jgi:hypothetical protein
MEIDMTVRGRKTNAAEVIGTWLGWDINEVVDQIYQPTLFFSPSVYSIGDDFVCCPTSRQKPPIYDRDGCERGFNWEPVFEWHGRTVYLSKAS